MKRRAETLPRGGKPETKSPSRETHASPPTHWHERAWPWIAAGAVLLLCFVTKPAHVDDPLFLWEARQIGSSPMDPFGFDVNWYGWKQPIHHVTCNPPLASYALAGIAALFGWSLVAFHLAFLVPALLVVLGTHVLARRWTSSPGLAAAAVLACPAFLVSASTLMCDVLMLAFWIWGLVLWTRGIEEERVGLLVAGAACALGAMLSKYFGVAVVGLMGLQALLAPGRRFTRLAVLALPLAGMAAYETWGWSTYGHVLFRHAGDTVGISRTWKLDDLLTQGLATLTFAGGCAAFVLFALPALVRGRTRIVVLVASSIAAVMFAALTLHEGGSRALEVSPWLVIVQGAAWVTSAVTILAVLVDEWRSARDPVTILLAAWILGTLAFAWLLNWTVNGRTILPMVPATAILFARRIGREGSARAWPWVAVACGAVISLLVAIGDDALARSQRRAAETLVAQVRVPGQTVWFQGHWGFQYYAEAAGAVAQDRDHSVLRAGDVLLAPVRSSNVWGLADEHTLSSLPTSFPLDAWWTTLDVGAGAGFYSNLHGPLPFALACGRPDVFWVVEVQ